MNGGGSPQLNVAVAATSVMARGNDPETLLPLVANERVSVWITAPIVLQRVLRSPLLPRTDCSSLSLVLVGGGSLSEALVAEAEEKLGARCAGVYGLTETSPFVSAALPRSDTPAAERRSRQATAGLPVLGVEVKVVDETGRDVADDGRALGEVLVRGNNVMSGYHRDEAGTQEALRSGFLHTGDLASVSPDGYLTIRGRKEDVIVASGHRVSAREIEAALAWHPDVRECAVIGVAHPERGQAPVALVVLREGARATERELLEHARQQLLAYKLPERIEFLPSLPRTEAGEVLRSELQMLYARS
jgi:fatty-acyl-CoA synthase